MPVISVYYRNWACIMFVEFLFWLFAKGSCYILLLSIEELLSIIDLVHVIFLYIYKNILNM